MGCDCGCGGTCPLCSRILARGMAHRSSVILEAARILDEKPGEIKETEKNQKKKKDEKK